MNVGFATKALQQNMSSMVPLFFNDQRTSVCWENLSTSLSVDRQPAGLNARPPYVVLVRGVASLVVTLADDRSP